MFHKIINKILSLYTLIRHGDLPSDLRYFYRDTYYCQLYQLKYLINDYIIKPKYKRLSFNGEFAAELIFVLPFVYWHHKNGTLLSTEASKYTKEFYFFSENHTEAYNIRSIAGNYNFEMPRILYSHNYQMAKWAKVPLKEHYKNELFKFEKPTLIIANRYNSEWGGPPISFLSIEALDYILNKLKSKYAIIYNRPRPQNIVNDNSDIYDLEEFDWLEKNHPEVLLMEDLFEENKDKINNFNHLQLMIYANSERFISTHGGSAALACYFGGINLILSKEGREHHFDCFNKLYSKLSDVKVFVARSDGQLKELIQQF